MIWLRDSNKRFRIIVVIVLFIVALLIHNLWGYTGNCVLCNIHPYHEPCVISLATGDIIPLTVYDPDPFLVGELANEQTDGYSTIFHHPGFSGYRDTNSRETVGKIQPCNTTPLRKAFCFFCRKELSKFSQTGFVVADLQNPTNFEFYSLENEARIVIRCYVISIILDTVKNNYSIVIKGTL